MTALLKDLKKRTLFTSDLPELLGSQEPIFLFDAIHLKLGGVGNNLLKRESVSYMGTAFSDEEEQIRMTSVEATKQEPILIKSSFYIKAKVKGDLFAVDGKTISLLDRFFMNGVWFNRELIDITHKDIDSGIKYELKALCYLASTEYWDERKSKFRYMSPLAGNEESDKISYFVYN